LVGLGLVGGIFPLRVELEIGFEKGVLEEQVQVGVLRPTQRSQSGDRSNMFEVIGGRWICLSPNLIEVAGGKGFKLRKEEILIVGGIVGEKGVNCSHGVEDDSEGKDDGVFFVA